MGVGIGILLAVVTVAARSPAPAKPRAAASPSRPAAAAGAAEANQQELRGIEAAFDDTEFEEVIARASRRLNTDTLLPLAERGRLHELVAFSFFYLNRKGPAEEALKQLFAVLPDHSLDSRSVTPQLAAFYAEVRDKNRAAAPPVTMVDTTQQAAPPATGTASDDASTSIQHAPVLGPSRWLGLLPGGIGHFLVGDVAGGVGFLTAEVALVSASVALYWLRLAQRQPGFEYANPGLANTLQVAQNVAAFAAIGLGVWSMIDGVVWAPERAAARRAQVFAVPLGQGGMFGVALAL